MSVTQAVIGARKERTCSEHGNFLSTLESINEFEITRWSHCPGCEADFQARKRKDDVEEGKSVFAQRLSAAGITQRFSAKTFADYQATNAGQAKALAIARDYAENFAEHFESGRCLIFSGKVGCGKTHLAAAICHAIIAKPFAGDGADWRNFKRYECRYATASQIFGDIRECWGNRKLREADAWAKFTHPHLLVIDEIGRQHGSDGERTILEELIDQRYSQMRPTLVISNCDREQIAQFIGERGLDRLFENKGIIAIFTWPSHRRGGK
jgi:DNA replication protein DnaC